MRLFIAIPLPKDVQKSVWAFEEALRENASSGNFVPRGNHHITLRFIGESSKLAELAYAMHEAVRDARPFPLKLGAYGSFTHGGARTSYLCQKTIQKRGRQDLRSHRTSLQSRR